MIKKQSVLNILAYGIAIILIINCNSIIGNAVQFDSFYRKINVLMMGLIILYVLLSKPLKKNIFILGAMLMCYLLIPMIIKGNWNQQIINYLRFIAIFFLVGTESKKPNLSLVLKAYINLMFVIALVSIFFWIFGSLMHLINPNMFVVSKWEGINRLTDVPSYYGLYYETQSVGFAIRNSAIFAEGPMAALNFLLALVLLDCFEKKNVTINFKIGTLIVAALSTLSTTAYISLILLILLKLIIYRFPNPKSNLIKNVFLIILIPVIIVVVHSLLMSKMNTVSGTDRFQDYMNAFKLWKTYPLFGTSQLVDMQTFGFSSSFTNILGGEGLWTLALFVVSAGRSFILGIRQNEKGRIIFTIILIYLFMITIFVNTYLIWYVFTWIFLWEPKVQDNEK